MYLCSVWMCVCESGGAMTGYPVNVCVYAHGEFDSLNYTCLCFQEVVGPDPTFPTCVRIFVCQSENDGAMNVYRCM